METQTPQFAICRALRNCLAQKTGGCVGRRWAEFLSTCRTLTIWLARLSFNLGTCATQKVKRFAIDTKLPCCSEQGSLSGKPGLSPQFRLRTSSSVRTLWSRSLEPWHRKQVAAEPKGPPIWARLLFCDMGAGENGATDSGDSGRRRRNSPG